jgi:drug/metabolite transporter (DMT)-like permease
MIATRTLTDSSIFSRPLPALSGRTLAILAVVGATVIWGSSSVATKAALAELPPMVLAFARLAVAYLVLRPLVGRSGAQPARGLLPALLGLTGFAGFVLLRNLGLDTAPASHGSLIEGGATPALAMLLGVALLAERPSSRHLVGMLASLAGVGFAVLPGMERGFGASLLADGLLLAGTGCFALYTVLGRQACAAGGSLAVVTGAMRYGLVALTPFAVAELVATGVPSPTSSGVIALLYLGAGCSAAAYALWSYGLSQLPAGQVALLSNLELVCGIVVAAALAGEAFTPLQLTGVVLVLGGIWFGTTTLNVRLNLSLPRPALRGRPSLMSVAAG